MAEKEYMFGVADVTIGGDVDPIKFDGKDFLQAEGGSISIAPTYTEFTFEDFGETIVERRLSGWEGTVEVVAGQEDARLLDLALASTTKVGEDGATDAAIGTKLIGQKVRIHPRHLDADNKAMDWVIYNAASIEGFERDYASEQGSFTISLTMMPREGFDASKEGNFFYRGAKDPNATP